MLKNLLAGTRSIGRSAERGYTSLVIAGTCVVGFALFINFTVFNKFTRVDQGYVGLKIDLYGSDRDEPEVLPPGGVWYGIGESIVEFPTFDQYTVLTRNANEGSPNDDSITFNVNGASVNLDVSFNYRIPAENANNFWSAYRVAPEQFRDTRVRSSLRGCFNSQGSAYQPADMYTQKLNDLLVSVTNCFNDEFAEVPVNRFTDDGTAVQEVVPLGLTISNLSVIETPRLPPEIQSSLTARLRLDEEVAQEQAETRRQREVNIRAQEQAEAQAAIDITNAEAAAEVARLEAQSIEAENLAKQALERWNGEYPNVLVIGDTNGFDLQQILPAIGGGQ